MLSNVCPSCGSGKIEPNYREEEKPYRCTACGEAFVRPMAINIDLGLDTAQEVAEAIAAQLFRALYEKAAQPMGMAIYRSGVVAENDSKALGALTRAACIGAHKAILEEAERLGQCRSRRRESAAGN